LYIAANCAERGKMKITSRR